jgi:hypothetical protein
VRVLLAKKLARLASLAAQRQYIVHGSRDAYYLPSELLNDAHEVVEQVRAAPRGRSGLAPNTEQAVLVLEELLAEAGHSTDRCGNEELIERDSAWKAVREQAARCLDLLEFNLQAWEKAEIRP